MVAEVKVSTFKHHLWTAFAFTQNFLCDYCHVSNTLRKATMLQNLTPPYQNLLLFI